MAVLAAIGSTTACSGSDSCMEEATAAWRVASTGGEDHPSVSAVAADGAGGLFLLTAPQPGLTAADDFTVERYRATDGSLLWRRRLDGIPGPQVAATPAGEIAVPRGVLSPGQSLVTLLDADGSTRWETDLTGDLLGSWIAATSVSDDGTVYVAGSYAAPGDPATEAWEHGFLVARLDGSTGAPLWVRTFGNESAYTDDQSTGIAVDADANVTFVGFARGSSDFDGHVLEPDGAFAVNLRSDDGTVLWAVRPDDWTGLLPMVLPTTVPAIGTGAGGSVVLAGTKYDERDQLVSTLTALGPSGEPMWSRAITGSIAATAVTIDPPTGDVVLTGAIYGRSDLAGDGSACAPPTFERPRTCGDLRAATGVPPPPSGGCSETQSEWRPFLAGYSFADGLPTGTSWFVPADKSAIATDITRAPDGLALSVIELRENGPNSSDLLFVADPVSTGTMTAPSSRTRPPRAR